MLHHVQELKNLNLPDGKFAIYGSGPLAVRGLRDSKDLDVIVSLDVREDLQRRFPDAIKDNPIRVEIGNLELSHYWMGSCEHTQEMIDAAECIDGLPFVRLEYVLAWKKSMDREKDVRDVELIEGWMGR